MTPLSLWFGEAAMGFGVIAFSLLALRARVEDRHHYLTSIVICLIATASYLAMALGQTHVVLADRHAIYLARYIDWLLTTPLLLLGTATIGMRAVTVNKTLVYAALSSDVFMIATGFAGALSTDRARWLWFAYSCIAFAAVLLLLWGPLRREAAKQRRSKAYLRLIAVLTVLWVQYPLVWLFGDEGLRVLSEPGSTLWYTLLDVTAKVAFGFLSLATVEALEPAIEEGGTIVASIKKRRIVPAE